LNPANRALRAFASPLTKISRVHVRALPRSGAMLLAVLAGMWALLWLYSSTLGPTVYGLMEPWGTDGASRTAIAAVTLAPLLVVALLAVLVWAGATAFVADAAQSRSTVSTTRSAAVASRRIPAALGAVLAWLLVVALAAIAAPVLLLGGMIGLLALVVVRPERRPSWWPRTAVLIACAVPFGVAVVIAIKWSLALPAVWLDQLGTREALRRSWTRTTHREVLIAVVLVLAIGLVALASEGAVALTSATSVAGAAPDVARMVVQILLAALPVVALTVLYRTDHHHGPPPTRALTSARRGARVPAVAATVASVLLAQAILLGGPISPASAIDLETPRIRIDTSDPQPLTPNASFDLQVIVESEFVEGSQAPLGSVAVSVDGSALDDSPFTLTDPGFGAAAIAILIPLSLAEGSHTVLVEYAGDSVYVPATESTTIEVGAPADVTLAQPSTPLNFGETLSLDATVAAAGSTAGGTVEFVAYLSGGGSQSLGTSTINGAGHALLETSALVPGDHSIVAAYAGDAGGTAADSGSKNVTVSALWTQTSIVLSPASSPGAPSPAGGTITATVTVTADGSPLAPHGSVEIYPALGGDILASGPVTAGGTSLDFILPPGSTVVQVAFSGDPGFRPSSNQAQQYVSEFSSSVDAPSVSGSPAYGEPIEVTTNVASDASGTATGAVEFFATPSVGSAVSLGSSSLDGSARATLLSTTILEPGDYTVTAEYAGDGTSVPATSSGAPFTIGKGSATVAVTLDNPNPLFGATVLATVDVTPVDPALSPVGGSVTILRDGVVMDTVSVPSFGSADVSFDAGDAGTHTITARYNGSPLFTSASADTTLTPGQRTPTVSLNGASTMSGTHGDSLTFTGAVSSSGSLVNPTGTVTLRAGGYLVGTAPAVAGGFSITSDQIPASVAPGLTLIASYDGDANFRAAQSGGVEKVQLGKTDSVPVVTLGPGTPGLGGTYTLSATLDNVGRGPSGTVTFYTMVDGLPVAIPVPAPVPVINGVAHIDYKVTATNTVFLASYSGDANFLAHDSELTQITADRAVADVVLSVQPGGPGAFVYGNVFELVARVDLGDASLPGATVNFRTASNIIIADDVAVEVFEDTDFPGTGFGVARVTVCAGDAAICGAVPALGLADQTFVATYPATAATLAGQSADVAYAPVAAPTSTSLVAVPNPVSPGGGLEFSATVTNSSGGPTPIGYVSFYGLEPTASGVAESFIGNTILVDGVAFLQTTAGGGVQDLRWPATDVIARFYGGTHQFAASSDSQAISIIRIGTSLDVTFTEATLGAEGSVDVTISHDPGVADDFAGQVSIFVDGSTTATCTVSVPAGSRYVSCPVSWATVGSHTAIAEYTGDVIYAPSSSVPTAVEVDKAIPVLGTLADPSPAVGTPSTITWTPGALTGTVTVFADGVQWCVVDVQDGECAGSYDNTSAVKSQVDIYVRYSGDANYFAVEDTKHARVIGCYPIDPLDVYSTETARGTVSVNTPMNCTGGYRVGTVVTVTAAPIAPNEFVGWRWYGYTGGTLIAGPKTLETTLTVTNDAFTKVRVADFRLPCSVVNPIIEGYGYFFTTTDPNCTTDAGKDGYLYGTTVTFTPSGLIDPEYGVSDTFYVWGTLPAGAIVGKGNYQEPTVTLTLTEDVDLGATFGPRCRSVDLSATPAFEGDGLDVTTATNCFQPGNEGYLPLATLDLTVASGSPDHVVTGWTAEGVVAPTGEGTTWAVTLGTANAVLTANMAGCYPVDLVVDAVSPVGLGGRPIGEATLDASPNCPDGSERYLEGTEITATPTLLVDGADFRGWDDAQAYPGLGAKTLGELTENTKVFTVTGPTTVTAVFSMGTACSRLTITDRDDLVSFSPTGCGPGMYADTQKQWAAWQGEPLSEFWKTRYLSTLQFTKNNNTNLDVYASIRGNARGCMDEQPARGDESLTNGGWRSIGAVGSGTEECNVGGNVDFRFEQCQTLDPGIALTVNGDESTVFGTGSLPKVLYLPTAEGTFAPMAPAGFNWVIAQPMYYLAGELETDGMAPGPCADAGNAFQPGLTLLLGADTMTPGFVFNGWTSDIEEPLVPDNPILIETDDTTSRMQVSASYGIDCFHVTFGEGISVLGDAPRCPGYTDEENMFIGGTAILIEAAQNVNGRTFGDWESGIIRSTVVKDGYTEIRTGFAYVKSDMRVAVDYPTEGERVEAGLANAGKILAGVAAIAAPIALGVACPPCGIVMTGIVLAAAVTTIIPGADDVTAFFDIVNPAKILECTTSWGFGNGQNETATESSIETTTGGIKEAKKVIKYMKTDAAAKQAASDLASLGKDSATTARNGVLKSAGKNALQLAGFAYSLYDAGLFSADLGYATTDSLRDTDTFTNCVEDAQRLAH